MNKRIAAGIIAMLLCAGFSACNSEENAVSDIPETAQEFSEAAVLDDNAAFTDSETVTEAMQTEQDELPKPPIGTLSSADTSDYGERFCGWKYDSFSVCGTASEFFEMGGSGEMLSAAENAVRESDIFKENERICQTAELGEDGVFYYTLDDGDEIRQRGVFSCSSPWVDENGHAVISFKSAACEDFDGDGEKEAFIIMTIPSFDTFSLSEDCAAYVDPSGKASFLCSGIDGDMKLIRYRDFAHIGFSFGCNNITTFSEIYAVENGSARLVRKCAFLGEKEGIAMSESAPQAPGSWLIVWDNIDRQYREIASEKAPEGLAEEIYNSSVLYDIKEYFSFTDTPEWLASPESLSEVMSVYGGKYICIGDFFNSCVLEYDGGELFLRNDRFISSGGDSELIYADLSAAQEKGVPEPVPEGADNMSVSDYSISEEGVFYSEEELFEAGGGELYNAALNIVKQSRYFGKISYQLGNAEKNGNTYTFPNPTYAGGDVERESYTYAPDYFMDGELVPLFCAAALEDFDGDGNKEAFITFRLPYKGYYFDLSGEKSEIEIAAFVSSDGRAEIVCEEGFLNRFDKFRLIRYEGEAHLLAGEDSGRIYSLRNGSPRLELSAVSPDGNGVSFNRRIFYSGDLKKYCYAEYLPLDGDILEALKKSPAAKSLTNGAMPPRRAWICGGRYIVTDCYPFGEYLYENGGFTRISDYGGGVPASNSELDCYDVIF
ncbi:MAG: hypothetical protein MSJ26_09120 [Oscillospiraceae bacterium]|nr:hypothetical protein [Oscillospiraceae bacterium]